MSVSSADKSKPYIPSPVGLVTDGYSKDGEATATCFCGAVQLAVVSLVSFHFGRHFTRRSYPSSPYSQRMLRA